jgi:hypothetical protein
MTRNYGYKWLALAMRTRCAVPPEPTFSSPGTLRCALWWSGLAVSKLPAAAQMLKREW